MITNSEDRQNTTNTIEKVAKVKNKSQDTSVKYNHFNYTIDKEEAITIFGDAPVQIRHI